MGISCPKCQGQPYRITEQAFVALNYSFDNGQFVQAPAHIRRFKSIDEAIEAFGVKLED